MLLPPPIIQGWKPGMIKPQVSESEPGVKIAKCDISAPEAATHRN